MAERNTLKERLRRGGTALGCFQRIPAAEVTEVCASAGFDFVVVDMEHAHIGEDRVADLVRAAEAAGIEALVRVPGHDPATIGRALDTGAPGLHVPRVGSSAEAAAAVAATRYAPQGSRGLATSRRTGYGGRGSLAEQVAAADEVLVAVQVEDRAGLEQVDAIAALPGVDVVFIGLTDLSADLGVPGRYDDDRLQEVVAEALQRIGAQGKAAGVPVASAAMAEEYLALGASYLTTNDVRLLLEASGAFVHALR
ncbi:MAG TPA: aldolase/citrate lyase family protein [Gaiellaceae bacterium]